MFKTKSNKASASETYLTEIIHHIDSRAWKLNDAKLKELSGLIENNRRKIVWRKQVSPDANTLNGRFVLAIKDEGTNKEVFLESKICCTRTSRHLEKIISTQYLSCKTTNHKNYLSIAAIFDFNLYSSDVT